MGSKIHTVKDMTLVAVCASILFVQQLALSFIPNVQFSTLLIILYAKLLGFRRTTFIIIIHVLAINMLSPYGAMNPVLLPAMFIAWMIIPVALHTIFKRLDSAIHLSVFGLVYGFVYGWVFIPFSVFILGVPFKTYFLADIPFKIVMAVSNFVTILWLYDVLRKAFETQLIKYKESHKIHI